MNDEFNTTIFIKCCLKINQQTHNQNYKTNCTHAIRTNI